MNWVSLVIVLLKVVSSTITFLQSRQLITSGQDAEIARSTVAILTKTKAAKAIMQEVTAMTDDQVDAALKGLETPP